MRVNAAVGIAVTSLPLLSGCSATMSHHDAGMAVVLGGVTGAICLVTARFAGRPDGGATRPGAAACGIVGILAVVWATIGAANLILPEPVVSGGVYQCRVGADHHIVVSIRNAGQTVLVVGSVQIQPEDGNGQALGGPVKMFLPAIFKMPKQFTAGQTRIFDVGAPALAAGVRMPVRCRVTGASGAGGNGRGSILSKW